MNNINLAKNLFYFNLFSIIVYLISGQMMVEGLILTSFILIYLNYNNLSKISISTNTKAITYSILLFLAYGALSAIWSINSSKTIITAFKILSISLFGITGAILAGYIPSAKINKNYALIALTLFNIVIILENLYKYPINNFLRHIFALQPVTDQPIDRASLLITALLPIFYIRFFSNNIWFYLCLTTSIINYLTNPVFASALAFITSFTVMFLHFIAGNILITAIFTSLIIALIFAPFIFSILLNLSYFQAAIPSLPRSWYERVMIWEEVVELIKLKPLAGFGLGTSNYINYLEQLKLYLTKMPIPLHPHNALLHIWLELGLVGALCFSLILFFIYKIIINIKDKTSRMCIFGSFNAILIYELVSYGIWQSWFLSAIFIVIIFHKLKSLRF